MIHPKTMARFEKLHLERVVNIKNMKEGLPAENELLMLWTKASFNSWSMVLYCIKYLGVIEHLTLSTYSINGRIITALRKHLKNGNIKHLTLLVSDSIRQRLPKVEAALISLAKNPAVTILYAWNHSKVTLIKCGEGHFTIEGSGNLSENAMYEQYIIFNNEQAYNFREKCITTTARG